MNTTTHPKRPYLVMDIETAPLPESELVVPEFEPAANLKDPEKIKVSIAEKKAKWMSNLALSPMTGQICAIGLLDENDEEVVMMQPDWSEQSSLRTLFKQLEIPQTIVTWNGNAFDWPFLLRRAWRHGITPPSWLREGRYWNRMLVDCRELWGLGDRQCEGTLGEVARFLGLGDKSGSGADFAKLLSTDPAKAREYLVNDLRLTAKVYERIHQTF